ncbi:GIN domain-containing protein [Aurantibacillus circumpalustris]|uniref:GIN domain-containing protein n=1 Tax=Aurantibacillus circumpalustris TaxID=3036359 RepID=UPI0037C0F3F8
MEVSIFQGTEYKVEVTAGENIIKNISTKIKDDTLRLDNNNKCNVVRGYKRKVKIKITSPYLEQVSNYGVGPITFDEDVKQDKIFVKAENSGDTYINGTYDEIRTSSHGNGDMYLKGTTKNLQVYTSGTNFTKAEELTITNYVFISSYSIGDAFFNIGDNITLDYLIWSDGSIYYKGNAHVNNLSEKQGKGLAIKQD